MNWCAKLWVLKKTGGRERRFPSVFFCSKDFFRQTRINYIEYRVCTIWPGRMVDTLRKKQVGFRVSLYLIALFLLLVPTAVLAAPAGGQEAPVIWVVVKGEIDQGQTALVKRAAEMAEREQAQHL